MNDPYRVLGVPPGVSDEQLHDAYRRLVKLHHPDRGGSAERFKDIQQAYEELRNRPRAPRKVAADDVASRMSKLEDEVREAQAARERARQAARDALRDVEPPAPEPVAEEEDSFGRILSDVRDELADKLDDARHSSAARHVHDLIDGLEDLTSRLDRL